MGGHQPEVWISDRLFRAAKAWRSTSNCLAHLARDTAFALEHGSDDLPLRFKLWFGKAFDLAADIADFRFRDHRQQKARAGKSTRRHSRRGDGMRPGAPTSKPKSDARETSFSPSATIPRGRRHQ